MSTTEGPAKGVRYVEDVAKKKKKNRTYEGIVQEGNEMP